MAFLEQPIPTARKPTGLIAVGQRSLERDCYGAELPAHRQWGATYVLDEGDDSRIARQPPDCLFRQARAIRTTCDVFGGNLGGAIREQIDRDRDYELDRGTLFGRSSDNVLRHGD